MIKRIVVFILIVLALFLTSGHAEAQDNSPLPAITIINPIRGSGLGHESDDLVASLKAQWQVTKDAGVNATWLFQYGALENNGMTEFAKREMKGQEFGLLFEIDRNYAEKSGVRFRGQGAWYRSDGLLLSSYDIRERHKLIDTAFAKFKETFGYYPKTTGAWWIGGDSLTYMQEKYGITAALRAADQFNLDFYSIWGTPWNIPYLSAKNNEGMPAASYGDSSKVVLLQWAIRDPLRGYADATYSLQDYSMKGYTSDYVNYLASVFLQKPYDNFVMGLENGATLEQFQKSYGAMLTKAKELVDTHKATLVLAKDFAREYLGQKKVFAGQSHFLSTDYTADDQSFWYMSQNYRAAIQKIRDVAYLIDLRDYSNKSDEDFTILPGSAPTLQINEPARVDSMRFPESRMVIASISASLTMKENGNDVTLYAGNQKLAHFTSTSVTMYPDKDAVREYDFADKKPTANPLLIISALYAAYVLLVYLRTRNYRKTILVCLPLVIPALLASTLLLNHSAYLFDQKELPIAQIFFSIRIIPIALAVYFTKILPLGILLMLHYFLMIRNPKKSVRNIFYIFYALVIILYARVPYFPLDATTYKYVFIAFAFTAIVLFTGIVYISVRKRSWSTFVFSALSSVLLLILMVFTVLFSRNTVALTNFQIDALNVLRKQNKAVLFVEQKDYGIQPIYKAVRPMLYEENLIGQSVTGTKWQTVTRPEDHVLKITNYSDTIIVIPRYLGADISEYEMSSLKLKKIFDNAQIVILEKL